MAQNKMTKKESLILKAVRDLVAENGFHGSPASQIAERAGVGVGTIYRYFENKDTLIYKAFTEIKARLIRHVFQDDEALPVRERFVMVHKRLIHYLIAHPNDFKFLEQFHNSPYGIKNRQEESLTENTSHPLKRLFKHGKTQQIIKDMPDDILCGFSFGTITFLIKDHFNGFFDLNEENIQMIVESCWDAIRRTEE